MRTGKHFMSSTALVSGLLLSTYVVAADVYVDGSPSVPTVLPAVSGINGKIAIEGGALDAEGFAALSGSITLPVGYRYGLQLDAMVGVVEDDFIGGVGGHLFWRDPSLGLLGIYGSYSGNEHVDGDISRIGVEGEYYWNQFTFKTVLGAEFIDINLPAYDETNFFAFTDLSYYAMDNLELSIGHRYTGESNALALGVEYQLDQQVFSSGVSLYAEGRIGEDSYQGAWAGVRMYLGDNKSLIRRHREDDPTEWGEDNIFGITNGAENCVPDAQQLINGGRLSEGYNTCTGVTTDTGSQSVIIESPPSDGE
ncbi:MAG: hypothetical protein AB8B94_08795 [Hyphomicrobiales bacterium]